MRRAWQRNGIAIILFAGLFAAPLLIHVLARQVA
jgi:hypothetical protein